MADPVDHDLAPEAVIAQLRTIRSQIRDIEPLPKDQRKRVRRRIRALTTPIVEASINVIGVLDNVSQAIGQPLDEVRQLQDDSLRWDAVAEEARAFLKGIEGANLIRRERIAIIAAQAYAIGTQLAKDPAKSVLVPHVEEVKRLRAVSRRRKAQGPQPPPPVLDPSTTPKS